VPPIPVATFLAGSLLSLLIPLCLFIALTVWYVKFVRRVPDTTDASEPGATTAPSNPAPSNPAPSNRAPANPAPTASPEAGEPRGET
jgi:hypothetical protein